MILYQIKFMPGPIWQQWPEDSVAPEDFKRRNFKINNVMYTRWTPKFEKALLWEQLQA